MTGARISLAALLLLFASHTGAGVQARLQVEALKLVRDFKRLRVWARDRDKAAAYCVALEGRIGVPVEASDSREALVKDSEVVITATQTVGFY